jgi:hypothetical protein
LLFRDAVRRLYCLLGKQEERMPELPFFDSIAASVLTTSGIVISPGPNGTGSNTGIIHSAADQDWFRISLRAGELYQFQMNSTSAVDPTLALRNAAGVQLAFDDDSGPGLNSLLTFRAPTAGVYYLDAGGFSTTVGSYTVVANEVPATTATYASVGVGASAQGDIQDANDQDWFAISLLAGQSYIFDAHGVGLSDPTLALRNSVGTQLAFNDDGGPGLDSRVEFTAAASGTYFLDVGGFSTNTGSYTLSTRIDDAADDVNTTDSVAVGGSRTGTINSAADQDFYAVSLTAGQSYIFDAHGVGLSDPTLALRNSAGTQVAFNDDGGPGLDSRVEFTATASGTYFLDVGGFGTNTGSYTLATRIDDVADDVNTTDSVAVGGARAGTIDSASDEDWFSVSLTAGQSYIFDAHGVGLSDTTLTLRNSAGTQVAFNDDGGPGLDSRIEITPASSGMYFLDVGGFGANTGSYSLATRIDDVSDDVNTIDSIAVNGVRSGTINSATDQDFYQILLTAGQSYTFDAVGVGLSDPTLAVRNGAGTQLAFNDDSGGTLNSHINFTAPSSGTFYLDVGGFGAATGTYNLFG